jgi:hypothetical protein
MGCQDFVRLHPFVALARLAIYASVLVGLAWAARSVPNEIRPKYGGMRLLATLLPGAGWRAHIQVVDQPHVARYRSRTQVLVLIFLGSVAASEALKWATYRCIAAG